MIAGLSACLMVRIWVSLNAGRASDLRLGGGTSTVTVSCDRAAVHRRLDRAASGPSPSTPS